MKWRLATTSLLLAVLSVPAPVAAAPPPDAVTLRDPRITESSGLVDLGSTWVTTNDSGDGPRVFVVDPRTGRTIGITDYHQSVQDVEALAPAGPGAVWVGDIGDNESRRRSVSLFRVTVGLGRIDVTPRRYRLVYPHGHPNAESLFRDKRGALYVITKSIGGGVVYRAPTPLSPTRPNRLRSVGRVVELATDAALTRDGRHVIVRGPAFAGVYTVPGFQRVGSFRLPVQRQGEGITVGPTGVVRVSSEGRGSAVRRVALPTELWRVVDPASAPRPAPSPSPSPSTSPSTSPSPSPSTPPSPSSGPAPTAGDASEGGFGSLEAPWLMWSVPAVIALGALGIGLGLRRRTE